MALSSRRGICSRTEKKKNNLRTRESRARLAPLHIGSNRRNAPTPFPPPPARKPMPAANARSGRWRVTTARGRIGFLVVLFRRARCVGGVREGVGSESDRGVAVESRDVECCAAAANRNGGVDVIHINIYFYLFIYETGCVYRCSLVAFEPVDRFSRNFGELSSTLPRSVPA